MKYSANKEMYCEVTKCTENELNVIIEINVFRIN